MTFSHHLFPNRLVALSLMSQIAILFSICAPLGRGQAAEVAPGQSASGAGESLAVDETMEKSSPVAAESVLHRSINYVGKYHLMVLHFPIAFLLAAMLVLWYGILTGRGDGIVAVLLGFGMFGAVAAAVLGWNVSLRFRLFRRRTNPTLAPTAGNWHRSRNCWLSRESDWFSGRWPCR